MCRFLAYHGPPLELDELLYRPAHSLVHQSTDAREREEPLNGDGWGVGWYEPDRSPEPAVYREVRPAWNDENMRRVSPLVRTPLYFAHVRAASPGLAVQQLNCHPFPGGQHTLEDRRDRSRLEEARQELLFMHNGAVGDYGAVIRRLREELPDDVYFGIRGTTDSEHLFALLQDLLGEDLIDADAETLAEGLRETLSYVERLKAEAGDPAATTTANLCVSDGESVVATRYATGDYRPESLYVGEAGSFEADGEFCATSDPHGDAATILASETLFEDDRVWREVPPDHLVVVEPDGEVTLEPLGLEGPGT